MDIGKKLADSSINFKIKFYKPVLLKVSQSHKFYPSEMFAGRQPRELARLGTCPSALILDKINLYRQGLFIQ